MDKEIEKKNGRPTVMTLETVAKLEEVFLNGGSDKEAIFLAGISSATFYNYQKENPEFIERKEGLRDMVKYKARTNVAKEINAGDKILSQWYLERKVKEEFSQKTETDITSNGNNIVPILVTFINAKDDTNTRRIQEAL